MTAKKLATDRKGDEKQGGEALDLGSAAMNDAGSMAAQTPPSLDALAAQFGPPSAFATAQVFAGFGASAGLDQGQQVASERILNAVPVFARDVSSAWTATPEARRRLVLGFTPAMLSVLVAETVTLRGLSERYDRVARLGAQSRSRCEALARDAQRDARDRHAQCARMLKKHMPIELQTRLSLDTATENTETPAALALSLESVAGVLTAWRAAMSADESAWYGSLGFDEGLAGELAACASALRESQADLVAVADPTRVTQRQLDEQDGRVLHLIGVIHLAFRMAAKRDARIVVPDLGELASVFVRANRGGVEEAQPAPPEPVAPRPG